MATAAPTIANDFHALEDIAWWTAAYLLLSSTFQLFYGKLYTYFSVKTIYMSAIGVFSLGSLVCTTAPTSSALITGRAIAGLGAAGMFSGSVMVLTASVSLERRPTFLGLATGMYGVASVAGPFLGGALTDRSTWRWCFGINLPIAATALLIVVFFVHDGPRTDNQLQDLQTKLKRFDFVGLVLLIGALTCMLLALQWGGGVYSWGDGRLIALFVVFGVLLISFVLLQALSTTSRTVPSTIYKNRGVCFAMLFACSIAASMFVAIIYLPIWFQAVKQADALQSGTMIMPLVAGFVICSFLGGGLITALGYFTPFMLLSGVLITIGAGLLTILQVSTPQSQWIGFQAVFGFGVGFGLQQPFLVVQTVLEESDVAIAVALLNLVQSLAGAIFVAIAQGIFVNLLKAQIAASIEGFDVDLLLDTGATNITRIFTPDQFSAAAVAYNTAIARTLYVCLGLSCLLIVGALGTPWQSMKKKPAAQSSHGPGNEALVEKGVSQ